MTQQIHGARSVREGRDAIWSIWQTPVYELRTNSGFWSKALSQSINNYVFIFSKQLLACYEALGETECLTMDCEVTTRPELCFMNWAMCDPQSQPLNAQEPSIFECEIELKKTLKIQVSCTREWSRTCVALPLQHCFFS